MYKVYILKSIKFRNKLYTGFTTNLENRVKGHNCGRSPHTSKFKPWEMIWYCGFNSKEKAHTFEKYLKTASGIAFRNKRLI